MAAPSPVRIGPTATIHSLDSDRVRLYRADALSVYGRWEPPVVIVSDGPYGLGGEGDLPGADGLTDWYEPHANAWAGKATALTTLWFWNRETGWAAAQPRLPATVDERPTHEPPRPHQIKGSATVADANSPAVG